MLAAGVGASAAALAGCSGTPAGQPSGGGGTAPADKNLAQMVAEASKPASFDLPHAKLPDGKLTMRFSDSGDQKAVFFMAFFAAYEKAHSNITVDYRPANWSQISQAIPLGLRNGNAPDCFQLPGSISVPEAVKSNYLVAYDDIVPDFDKVKTGYPPGGLVNGINIFGGKTYAVSPSGGQRFSNLVLYNKDLVSKADGDLSSPVSWDDFRALMKKITKNGNGQYYGIVLPMGTSGEISGYVTTLAQMAGSPGAGGINWKTGEYTFTDPLVQEALELFIAMNKDGSVLPGSASLANAKARGQFPLGVGGVLIQGPWNIRQYLTDFPQLNLGVGVPPQKNPNKIHPSTYGPGGSNNYVISAKTKAGEVLGDMWAYIMSLQGQKQWLKLDGVGDPPMLPAAYSGVQLPALETTASDIAKKYKVLSPNPASRNPGVEVALKNFTTPQPDFPTTCVGLITGQVKGSVADAMKGVQDRYNKALDKSISVAKSRGAKVSREDWVFPDWNPDEPYSKLYKS